MSLTWTMAPRDAARTHCHFKDFGGTVKNAKQNGGWSYGSTLVCPAKKPRETPSCCLVGAVEGRH